MGFAKDLLDACILQICRVSDGYMTDLFPGSFEQAAGIVEFHTVIQADVDVLRINRNVANAVS